MKILVFLLFVSVANFSQDTARLKFLAETGDMNAQFELGYQYLFLDNPDYELARIYFLQAAEQGHLVAQHNLGYSYIMENNSAINQERAFYWYNRAANNNYNRSMTTLGHLYREGIGTEKNVNKSIFWFNRAIEEGDSSAYLRLAQTYLEPQYNMVNPAKALPNLLLAEKFGFEKATFDLGMFYFQQEGFIDENKALEYLSRVNSKKYPEVNYYLAQLYIEGIGGKKYPEKALMLINEWAQSGEPFSLYMLGKYYLQGTGTQIDQKKAFLYFSESAKRGNLYAAAELGILYALGEGTEKNLKKAAHWIDIAFDVDDPQLLKLVRSTWNDLQLWKYQ